MKILTILGARPQFIKAAAISRAIRNHNNKNLNLTIEEIIVHTGQHFDANMSDVFFEELGIPKPDYNLGIASLGHGAMTGRMLEGIETIIQKEAPDWMLVYGDTNSTLAGALAAAKLHIPIAHIEAGLRSFNMAMPEEINRVLTDRISKVLFCPTQVALNNLSAEGYPFALPGKKIQQIFNVGDVMYDVTLFYQQRAKETVSLAKWGLLEGKYVLCTLHRAENTDDPQRLESILSALREISRSCTVVLPLHPRTRNLLFSTGRQHLLDKLLLLEPIPYLEIQRLEVGARAILTDSGGIQKEAYFHKVPCITLRDETEWIETVSSGWNVLTGAAAKHIVTAFNCASVPATAPLFYGDGTSAARIVEHLAAI